MKRLLSRRFLACAIVFVLALAVRMTLLFGFHHFEIGRAEAVKVAISVARHRGFSDPYSLPTGPSAHIAPLYPALIAPFYAVFGDAPAADYSRFALNALAASAEYALLPLLAEALGLVGPSGWRRGWAERWCPCTTGRSAWANSRIHGRPCSWK